MLEQNLINFYKVSPGGNTTVLLNTAQVKPELRPAWSNIVMNPLHLGAEQVGFIDWPVACPEEWAKSTNLKFAENTNETAPKNISSPNKQNLPSLNMMGGEFCGNACRAYAAILAAEAGKPLPWRGKIAASGIEEPLSCFVSSYQGQLDSAIKVPLSAQISIEPFEGGALVRLPGITHILLPGNEENHLEMPEDLKKCAFNWKRKLNLLEEPAVGCVWFDFNKQAANMLPLVWVRSTNSYCLETACGSGAMALGLYIGTVINQESCGQPKVKPSAKEEAGIHSTPYSGCSNFYRINQPSGEALWLAYNSSQGKMPEYVWLGGPCRIIARGKTII